MTQRCVRAFIVAALSGAMGVAAIKLSAQSGSAVTSPNGIALSEFEGYEAWQVIAPSQPDNPGGCGAAQDGCIKAILGNPTMIRAYKDGFAASGTPVPDGAAMAKVEWHRDHVAVPYGVAVPGALADVSIMVKDSKWFPQTNGWGYATFLYDAELHSFKPSTDDPAVMRTSCHSCHTGVKARDYVFTRYAPR